MGKYIIKRVAMGVLSIFIVATLTFFLMNLVPGGPFVAEKSISKEAQAALEAKYGLDKPLLERYATYMTDFVKGDMGLAFASADVPCRILSFQNSLFRQSLRALR